MPVILTAGAESRRVLDDCAGLTLNEVMMRENPETKNWRAPTICMYRGQPVLREVWDDIVVAEIDVVIFVALPMSGGGGGIFGGGGGGGSNPLQIVLTVAVIAVAAWAGPALAGAMGLTTAAGALTGAGLMVAGITSAAVMMAGSFILGQIFPTNTALPSGQIGAYDAAQASPTYNINGAGNQARLYQPVPEGFGKIRIVPDKIAQDWSQYVDNEFYLYQVFGCGRGTYTVHSMSFGDTVFWRDGSIIDSAYSDVQIQIVEPGGTVTLFPDNVETSPSVASQELLAPNADGTWIGPFAANSAGTLTESILVSIILPRGIGRYNNSGDLEEYAASIEAYYRSIDDNGNGTSSWATLFTHEFKDNTLTAIRKTFTCSVAAGRYEVKVRRTTDSNSDGRTMDTIQWESMAAILPGSLQYTQQAIAVKIKATNTLSQSAANNFSVVQTRKLPLYNVTSGTWGTPVATRSFAAGLSAVLKSDLGGNRADSQIDLAALWGVVQPDLDAKGWNFDCWIDGTYDVWSLVVELCKGYLVVPRLVGHMVGFILDKAGRPVRHEFTTRDIVRGTFQPTWGTYTDNSPDDILVSYLDENAGYAQRDVRAVLPNSESRKTSNQSFLGIVNRDHAHAIGIAIAARSRKRRISYEFETEGVGRLLNIGDVCSVNHPRLRDTCCGAVSGWNESSLSIDLGRQVTLGENPYLSLTRPDGSPYGPVKIAGQAGNVVFLDADDYALVTVQGQSSPFAWLTVGGDRQPTAWTLQTGRDYKRRSIITAITSSSVYRFKLTVINDDPDVDSYDVPTPPWEYRSNLPVVESLAAPESLRGSIGGTATEPVLIASWLPVKSAQSYVVELSQDGINWRGYSTVSINTVETIVPVGAVWIRVAARRSDLQSPWAVWSGNTTLEIPAAPVPVLAAPYAGAVLKLSWPRVAGDPSYIVRIYAAGNLTVPVKTASLTGTAWDYGVVAGVDDGGPWRSLTAKVSAANEAGESTAGTVSAQDTVPTLTGTLEGEVAATSVTLSGAEAVGEYTGFVIAQGSTADFTASGATAVRVVNALPYTWDGLTPETAYYFRVAPKDAFFDVAGDFDDLNYSSVISVTTLASTGA